jgi:hypothetical protein
MRVTTHQMLTEPAAESTVRSRRWSLTALVVGVLLWIATLPTFGMSIFLAPIPLVLTGIAWMRAPHDDVFWAALAVTGSLVLSIVFLVIGVFTGDVGVGLE